MPHFNTCSAWPLALTREGVLKELIFYDGDQKNATLSAHNLGVHPNSDAAFLKALDLVCEEQEEIRKLIAKKRGVLKNQLTVLKKLCDFKKMNTVNCVNSTAFILTGGTLEERRVCSPKP